MRNAVLFSFILFFDFFCCTTSAQCGYIARWQATTHTLVCVDVNASAGTPLGYTGTGNTTCEYCSGSAVNFGWGICAGAFNGTTSVITSGPYLSAVVTPSPGYQLNITGIQLWIWSYANSSGTNWGARKVRVGYSTNGGASWTTWTTSIAYDNNDCEISHQPAGRNVTWSFALNTASQILMRVQPFDGKNASNTSYETDLYQMTLLGSVPVALPVELIEFGGVHEGGNNILNWKTASEKNCRNFSVEKSGDAALFYEIASVKGNGTSNLSHSYKFADRNAETEINYYRLKQVDFDNTFSYSTIIAISNKPEDKKIMLFPNPVTDNELTITFFNQLSIEDVAVYDVLGRTIHTDIDRESDKKLRLKLDYPQEGIYYIRSNSNIFTPVKFIVKRP